MRNIFIPDSPERASLLIGGIIYLIINEYPKVIAYNVYSQAIYNILFLLGFIMAQTLLLIYMKPWQKYTARYNSRCLTELHMFCVPDSPERIIAGLSGMYFLIMMSTSLSLNQISILNKYVTGIMFLGYLSPWRSCRQKAESENKSISI